MSALPTPNELTELLEYLTPLERAELDKLLTLPRTWEPQPGPQTIAFETNADITGYGGSAGGGKTDLMLGVAHLRHHRSIIFRRESSQLDGMIDRSRELLTPLGWKFVGAPLPTWRAEGRKIELRGVQHPGDERKFQGQPHDLIAFDEATEFLEIQVRFLLGWLRSAAGHRCRAILGFNPPTRAEGRWIISFFGPWLDPKHSRPALPGELRWYVADKDGKDQEVDGPDLVDVNGKMLKPLSRTFIPARLGDNRYLRETNYEAVLQALPEPLRSQMLYGDFRAGIQDDAMQLIPTAWVEAAMARWTETRPYLPRSAIGADIARGGSDKTVFSPRYGHWFDRQIVIPGSATPDGKSVVEQLLRLKLNDAPINMDVIGVGTSPVDIGKMHKLEIVPMNGSERDAEARDRSGKLPFANDRAKWYWGLREALDPELGDDLALPPDPELKADLCAPHWELTSRGIKVESKDDIITRLRRSPDKGDSIVYANAQTRRGMVISKRLLELSARA